MTKKKGHDENAETDMLAGDMRNVVQRHQSEVRVAARRVEDQCKWESLEKQLGPAQFSTWFSQAVLEDGTMYLPTRFQADWVSQHFRVQIERAFGEIEVKVRRGGRAAMEI